MSFTTYKIYMCVSFLTIKTSLKTYRLFNQITVTKIYEVPL